MSQLNFAPDSPKAFEERLLEVLAMLDQDKDEMLRETDVDRAVLSTTLSADQAELVAILKAEFSAIRNLHKATHSASADGITKADLIVLAKVLEASIAEEYKKPKEHLQSKFKTSANKDDDPAELGMRCVQILEAVRSVDKIEFCLYGNREEPLQAIKVDAIRQGIIGNCVFLAALGSVVSKFPQIVLRMIVKNVDGTYTVTFAGARDEPVTVNPLTLVELSLYSRLTEYGFWPALIEKAFGVYMQASSFRPKLIPAENSDCPEYWSTVFSLLTGQQGRAERFDVMPESTLVEILDKAHREKRAVTAWSIDSTLTTMSRVGIHTNHAYSVIKWDGESSRITLRNPWGAIPGSEPETESGEPLDGYLDGIFTIGLEDFRDCFETIHYENWSPFPEPDNSYGGALRQENEISHQEPGTFDQIRIVSFARILAGCIGFVCSVCLMWFPIDCLLVASASTHWPITHGEIIALDRVLESTGSSSAIADRRIIYSYEVAGKTYRSSKVGGMVDIMGGLEDQIIKEKFPVGKSVDVHYDPRSPAQAVLLTGFQPEKTALLVLCIFGGLSLALLSIGVMIDKALFSYASENL